MKRSLVLLCLSLAGTCYAATIKSNGAGGGNWSAPATWAGGVVPGNGDAVTIQARDTVIFDVNQSEFAGGIAGLTCDGKMNCSTSAGTYCLKTSADIGGTGTINCGSSGTPYPSNCSMTFDFGSKANSFECGSGLTLNLFCAEPTHPVIALSGAAPAGQTQLSVDTDVRGGLWAPGSTIRIDNVSGTLPDSEARVIAPGGITSGTIRVTAGLAAAKASGANVVLVTRNVRIIGSTDYAVKFMKGGVLDCEISGCTQGISSGSGWVASGTISGCTYGVYAGSGCTLSAMISGCTYGVNASSACTISGEISGCANGAFSCTGCTIPGIVSGCAYGVSSAFGCTVSGRISGCTYGVSSGTGCTISGEISGCGTGVYVGSACTVSGEISGCGTGVYALSGDLHGATFTSNAYDLRRIVSLSAFNTVFASAVENYEYNTDRVPQWGYVSSYDHDAVADDFKAWTRGGVVVSDANAAPLGYTTSYRHLCESGVVPCFRQESITVEPNQTLLVQGKILILDNHSAWPPRLELIDPGADPLVDSSKTALASDPIRWPNSHFIWQDVAVHYTNSGTMGRRIWIRCSAQRAAGDVYEVWTTHLQ